MVAENQCRRKTPKEKEKMSQVETESPEEL